ncbi:MAG: Na+/H+ antiporter subunit C [Pontiella sp.]
MEILLAIVVGTLYASGIYLMMRRNLVQLIIGLGLLSHGANLLIFIAGGLRSNRAPILAEGEKGFSTVMADPLPQALILTSIVISFALTAFALVLFLKTYRIVGTDDVDEMKETDT